MTTKPKSRGSRVTWDRLFSIEVPRHWSIDEDGNAISAYDPADGVGALTISLARRNNEQAKPTREEAIALACRFAEQHGWVLPEDDLVVSQCGDSWVSHFTWQGIEDGEPSFWVVWHIIGQDYGALLSYNCDPTDADVEYSVCKKAVESFRWEH